MRFRYEIEALKFLFKEYNYWYYLWSIYELSITIHDLIVNRRHSCTKIYFVTDVKLLKKSRCPLPGETPTDTSSPRPVPPTRFTTVDVSPTPSSSVPPGYDGFVVPQDILDSIFSTTTPEPDFSGLIDERNE
jgi:hypothetical protein